MRLAILYLILFVVTIVVSFVIQSPIPVAMFIVLLYLMSVAYAMFIRDRHPCEDD